ncbi:hypothetical protein EYF80_040075 [Liparis tanakae]|uniref:Uncharacterized protein n=1 Tax=Liparis tanakae TaxID=230148 RepID=A0A4Z2G829_9TELE|nr:hypothetical protein EYF80_040075 [Liparis tanakae]
MVFGTHSGALRAGDTRTESFLAALSSDWLGSEVTLPKPLPDWLACVTVDPDRVGLVAALLKEGDEQEHCCLRGGCAGRHVKSHLPLMQAEEWRITELTSWPCTWPYKGFEKEFTCGVDTLTHNL